MTSQDGNETRQSEKTSPERDPQHLGDRPANTGHNDGPRQDSQSRQESSVNNGSPEDDQNDASTASHNGPGKKPLIILAVVVLILVIVAMYFWLTTRNQETTDDAYTESDAVTISPKVSGYVIDLAVRDNQRVHKGDLLLKIDPRDYVAQRDQAVAQLGLAEAQLHQSQVQLALSRVQYPAQLSQAQAQLARAEANQQNAEAEYRRQRGVDPRATSQQNIDTANAQLKAARADTANARAQVDVARQVALQIRQAQTTVEARRQQVRQAKAQLESANLNLSYTEVRAPFDGFVTRRNVQPGLLVQAGGALMSVVSPNVWVIANFKESQLTHMRPGDRVDLSVDAYPSLALQGHVDSIQQGSGSRFSAFPAENATGNFVKIVQRVPVKIVIDSGLDPSMPLPLGLSVEPKVYLK
ncbi:HlyD family secretion protein [Martelella alba]|uniref:HlyD family secretion protein n=1 Tax=Martelella alba TaxID=2590451 RepID=A0ABY2SP96_9HYPH|nr:HlyD family secretion protein [Martelella alba]TKI07424.1 HlyD family secretion protein [Martelella alba]